MSRSTTSSSSSSSTAPTVSDKDLLAFYKRKYEEAQRKEDKYKEKIDRHLKNLVTDRVCNADVIITIYESHVISMQCRVISLDSRILQNLVIVWECLEDIVR